MKPLSIRLLAIAGMLAVFLSGFTAKPAAAGAAVTNTTAAATIKTPLPAATLHWLLAQSYLHFFDAPAKTKRDMSYYWYSYPSDAYVDYNTVANEEWSIWLLLGGVEVDTNPMGGTLLEKGYLDYGHPHGVVYVFLYGHFLL